MTISNIKLLSAIVAAIALAYTPVSLVAPAHAYDDDVEFVCGENDDGSDWCVSVEDLAAECPLTDPEYTTDECQGLLEDKRPGHSPSFLAILNAGAGNDDGGHRGSGPTRR